MQFALGLEALVVVHVLVVPAEYSGVYLELLIGAQFTDIGNFGIGYHAIAAGLEHAVEQAGDHRVFQPAAVHELQVFGIVQMHVQVNIQQAHPEFHGDHIKQLVRRRPFTASRCADQFKHPISLCHGYHRSPIYYRW